MTTNYTSIKSILYDLSLTIDDRYWNEIKFTEWLVHGLRQMNVAPALVEKSIQLEVIQHKAELPSDLKYLTQVVEFVGGYVSQTVEELDLPDTSTWTSTSASYIPWRPMRLTSNPFHSNICTDSTMYYCTDCANEFSVSPSMVLTTTLDEGIIMVAYLAYATSDSGDVLIPDNESLKEALLHYALFRYWMSKMQMKEAGADKLMKFHMDMWHMHSRRASGILNKPDINQLENIMSNHNRLVPRTNKFQQMFTTLGNRENVNF